MTAADIVRLLKKTGLRPQTAAGQNFLLSEKIAEQIVAEAEVKPGDTVLEVGPGFGILTKALLETGATVVAVELDRRLYAYLLKNFAEPRLTLINADIFKVNLNDYVRNGDYKLVANLPYGTTSLIFRNFLSLAPRPSSLTIMIQREVAKRVTAKPGQMSLLALMAQYYAELKYLFDVPRTQFYPEPEVDSTVVNCQVKPWPEPALTKIFFMVTRAGFSSRRKQLKNSLAAGLNISTAQATEVLQRNTIKETARAQDLSLENWLGVAKFLG